MQIQDFHAIYINLEKDIEKNNRIKTILKKLNIKHTRLEGVYGKNLTNIPYRNKIAQKFNLHNELFDVSFWMNRSNFKTMTKYQNSVLPKVGAFLSHTLAIKKALEMGLDKVLILEDDMNPLINVNSKFSIPKDADIYYLGGSFWTDHELKDPKTDNIRIDGQVLKMVGGFAYIIPSREKMIDIYNVLMSVFNDGKSHDKHKDWRSGQYKLRAQAIDLAYVNHFQKNGNCYISNPVKISHKELGSNIENNRKRYNIKHYLTKEQQNKYQPMFN
uniref:Glycosyl transferase family 25 domain-containing protein n=1 Tax=viral metagenome TaxID=1070528 RepID=A0A6C0JCV0_9ZZZZ